MNLVIDDAVEVKQPTKLDPEEGRRELGLSSTISSTIYTHSHFYNRADTIEGRQRFTNTKFAKLRLF